MSDTRPSLENRLSSRLSRSTAADRLLQRAALHAGGGSVLSRLAERREQTAYRREAVGSSLLDTLISRLATRGAFRAASPVFGAWGGTDEVVRSLPPWLSRQRAAEEPVPQVRRSPWIGAASGWNQPIVPVASTARVARQAARPAGFRQGEARRSAIAAPDLFNAGLGLSRAAGVSAALTTTDGFARRSASGVGALGFGRDAGLGRGPALARSASRSARATTAVSRAAALFPSATATTAAPGAPLGAGSAVVARASRHAVARSAGSVGAARGALAREFASAAPVSAPGRALARSESARPSGRGFAVARSAGRGYIAPDLESLQAPTAAAPAYGAENTVTVDGFARRSAAPAQSTAATAALGALSRAAQQQASNVQALARSTAVTATWGALSRASNQTGPGVTRALARSTAVTAAATRPLARATQGSPVSAVGREPGTHGFAPLTRSASRPHVGASTAAAAVSRFTGSETASPGYSAFTGAAVASSLARRAAPTTRPAPVARAFERQAGGATRAGRQAASGLPRSAAILGTAALALANAPTQALSRATDEAAARPMTRRSAEQSGWRAPVSTAEVARAAARSYVGAPTAQSTWTAPGSSAQVARQSSRPLTGASVARQAATAWSGAPTASSSWTAPGSTAAVARSASRPLTGAPVARQTTSDWSGAPTATSGAPGVLSRAFTAPSTAGLAGPTMSPVAGLRRSAGVPTAVARATGATAQSTAVVARASAWRGAAGRSDTPSSTVARSLARGVAAPSAAMRRFAPAGPALEFTQAPTISRREAAAAAAAGQVVRSPWTSTPVAAPGAPAAGSTAVTAVARSAAGVGARTATPRYSDFTGASLARSRSTSVSPAARALARYSDFASAPTAGSLAGFPGSTATVARVASRHAAEPSFGLSRQLRRDAATGPTSTGTRPLARSLTAASALGTPASIRRMGLPSIDGTVAAAPTVRRQADGTVSVVEGFAAPTSSAQVARSDARTPTSAARTAIARAEAARSRATTASPSYSAFQGTSVSRSDAGGYSGAAVGSARYGAFEGATVARQAGTAPRSPAARALARAAMGIGSTAITASPMASGTAGIVNRAATRLDAPAARAAGRARPLTTARSFDGTLAGLPPMARSAASTEAPAPVQGFTARRSGSSASTAPSPWISGLPGSTAVTAARSASDRRAGAPTAGAFRSAAASTMVAQRTRAGTSSPSVVSRALARTSDASTGAGAGLGFRSPRAGVSRAQRVGWAAPDMPVASALLARSAGPAPESTAGFGSPTWSPWMGAPTARADVARSASSVRSAPSRAQRSTSTAVTAKQVARRAGPSALTADLPRRATGSSAATAGPLARSASGAARTAEWGDSGYVGAALARAVSRSTASSEATASSPLRRSVEMPAGLLGAGAARSASPESAVRRRAMRRGLPGSTAAVARAAGGGGFSGEFLARLARVQASASPTELGAGGPDFDATVANAGGLIRRAAGRMVARREDTAKRRAQATLPRSTAMTAQQPDTLSRKQLSRLIKREVADLAHIQGAAPTVSRSARVQAIKRSSSAAEAQGRGADRDVGKKPDLDDFLRRAMRRILVEEDVLRSRELSTMD